MNHRDEYGMEPRVPETYKNYILTLDDLDSHVYEFGRGCEDGQKEFVDFVMSKVLTADEWETLKRNRDFVQFCEKWERLEQRSIDRYAQVCVYGYEPISDDYEDFHWPFCVNCGKVEEAHCRCGDCTIGQAHLQWALDHNLVRRA